ncbi:MAG TPA: ABC transporter permease [Mycobacteriales bacterium]|nr:ABC transporter permease [Mycobacteriales bacterium]
MTTRPMLATAARVLSQLRHDRRTVALLLVVPVALLILFKYVYQSAPPVFDRVGPIMLGLFPFVTMFLVTSIAMVRERTSGTLERLLTTPLRKFDLLAGYALAFGVLGLAQAGIAAAVALGPLGLTVSAGPAVVVTLAVINALLGMALGLFLSAFASTEFQAVQFLPAAVLPQVLLCGLLAPPEQMGVALRWASDVLPLTYAVDALTEARTASTVTAAMTADGLIVIGCIVAALALGAATLRRRTP